MDLDCTFKIKLETQRIVTTWFALLSWKAHRFVMSLQIDWLLWKFTQWTAYPHRLRLLYIIMFKVVNKHSFQHFNFNISYIWKRHPSCFPWYATFHPSFNIRYKGWTGATWFNRPHVKKVIGRRPSKILKLLSVRHLQILRFIGPENKTMSVGGVLNPLPDACTVQRYPISVRTVAFWTLVNSTTKSVSMRLALVSIATAYLISGKTRKRKKKGLENENSVVSANFLIRYTLYIGVDMSDIILLDYSRIALHLSWFS